MNRFLLFSILFRYFGARYITWFTISLSVLIAVISLIQSIELLRRFSARDTQVEELLSLIHI